MKKKIKLDDLPRKDIFTIPEGYFDTLPKRIQERKGLPEQQDLPHGYRLLPKKMYYIAASVAVFLIAMVLLLRTPTDIPSDQNILASVSTEAMIEYLEMSDVSVVEITLAEEEQQQLLENQWQNLSIPEEYVNEFSTEELDEFL